MTHSTPTLIRSRERVRDLGEVFTRPREVRAMCDLLPSEVWENPLARFLEPSCGAGAFLIEILQRKLTALDRRLGTTTAHARQFGTLLVVSSIYGVDISAVNVTDSRAILRAKALDYAPKGGAAYGSFKTHLDTILAANIQLGDFLKGQDYTRWEAPFPGLIVGSRGEQLFFTTDPDFNGA